jgi:HD-like signal output (HDOD) protein
MYAISNENPSSLDSILTNIDEIAVLPHAIYKILEISGSNDAGVQELEGAIVIDPGFSAKLLAHANSAYYALPRHVTSIKDAVMFLGFKTIRQMAMTVGFFDLFAGKTDKESLRRRFWWRSSIDTAIVAKWFAQEAKKSYSDEAYTAGLLHQIGKTILDRSRSGAYDEVEDLMATGLTVFEAEQKVFGCDHVEVAVGACKKWGLPKPIWNALQYKQEPDHDDPEAGVRSTVALGHATALAATEGLHIDQVPFWAARILGLSHERAVESIEQGTEHLATHGNPTIG